MKEVDDGGENEKGLGELCVLHHLNARLISLQRKKEDNLLAAWQRSLTQIGDENYHNRGELGVTRWVLAVME